MNIIYQEENVVENKEPMWTAKLIKGSFVSMSVVEGKKKPKGLMMGWSSLQTSKIDNSHECIFALCGQINDIIVLDFDNYDEYLKLVNDKTFNNAHLYPSVKTMRGIHVYFKYTNAVMQPDKSILNVDVQGNNKMIYLPPTKYKLADGSYYHYKWKYVNDLKEMPIELINYINSCKKIISTPTPPICNMDISLNAFTGDLSDKMKFVELIDDKYLSNREDWLKIVFAMKRECFTEQEALRISNKASKCEPLTSEAWDATWNSEDSRTTGVSMGTLKHYAKLSNPTEYAKLVGYSCKNDFSDSGLARQFDDLAGEKIVYAESDKEFYCWYKNKWRKEDKDGKYIRRLINATLTVHFQKMINDDNHDSVKKIITSCGQSATLNNIWKELQSIVVCRCDKIEFDVNPDVIAFNNKKYNFKTKEWSKIEYDDYLCMNTGRDYIEPTTEQVACIDKLFNEIFPNPEIKKCYLSILYNACIGGKKDKFVMANGGGANGKGLIHEALKVMLGDYAYDAPISLLTKEFRGGANPELANIHKKRLVCFKEPDESEKLFLGNIKTLVDNDTVNARQLYKGDCKVVLNALLVMELNVRLQFSGRPTNAEVRRFMDILFESTFTDDKTLLNDKSLTNIYPANRYYKSREFQEKYCSALFKYIIDNADDNVYTPDCVRERTKCYIDSNNTFGNWWQHNYKITGEDTDIVKVKDMFNMYKDSDDYKNMRRDQRPNLTQFTMMMVMTENKLKSRYRERFRFYKNKKQIEVRSVLIGMISENNDSDDED